MDFYCQIQPNKLKQSLALRRAVGFIPFLFVPAVAPSLLAMPRCFLAKQSNSNCTDKLEWRSSEGKKQSHMSDPGK